ELLLNMEKSTKAKLYSDPLKLMKVARITHTLNKILHAVAHFQCQEEFFDSVVRG
ncbi:unnamed protein product, partial [Sphenostylis stenocarpa]